MKVTRTTLRAFVRTFVRVGAAFAFFGVTACSGGCGGGDEVVRPSTTSPTTSEARETFETAAADPTSTTLPTDPAPAPELSVELVAGDVLRVRNVGTEPTRVRGAVRLERHDGEAWTSQPIAFGLRARCGDAIPECVTLAPGAELLPPAWLGTVGDAQCDCDRCAPAEGELRFVLESCAPEGHAPHVVTGTPFTR
ncbi:MAG: hypothetical protein H6721_15550 [Sandaracinus sp.]|nr:hypothetical protein [Sandaracinus sp.]MCB9633531.1 hypothetical protein [Sandaracinus sp.]